MKIFLISIDGSQEQVHLIKITDKELQPLAKMEDSLQQVTIANKKDTVPNYMAKWESIINPVSGTRFKEETTKPSFEEYVPVTKSNAIITDDFLSKFQKHNFEVIVIIGLIAFFIYKLFSKK